MVTYLDILLVLACAQGAPAPERIGPGLIRIQVESGARLALASDELPGQVFSLAPPQYIGHLAGVLLDAQNFELVWRGPDAEGAFETDLSIDTVAYGARVVPFHDHVDLIETLENRSADTWKHAFTFACCRAELAPAFRDPELARTFMSFDGKAGRLGEAGGTSDPAPAIEFYWPRSGKQPEHAFVGRFKATSPRQTSASYAATTNVDGNGVFACGCKSAAFLYRNTTRSCMHVAPDFGDLAPGARGFALTRIYLMTASGETFARRYARDFEGAAVAPSIRVAQPAPPFVHLNGVEIFPPWPAAGHVMLRFPETLGSSLGLLFIDHELADMQPIAHPPRAPMWRAEPGSGALVSRVELPGLVAFTSRAAPAGDGVDLSFKVENLNARKMDDIRTQMCLVQSGSPLFADRNLTRTFISSGGRWLPLARSSYPHIFPDGVPRLKIGLLGTSLRDRPQTRPPAWAATQELAGLPLLATRSPDGEALLGLTWKNGTYLVCNGSIPCLHVDPAVRDCAPRSAITLEGHIYLVRESLEALQQRFQGDTAKVPSRR